MSRKLSYYTFVVFGMAAQLLAQPQQNLQPKMYLPASEPDIKKLLADREAFVVEYYQPDEIALAKIRKDMNDAAAFQENYHKDSALTLSRISLAMGIVASEQGMNDQDRAARMSTFSQRAGALYSRSPLSLAKVAKMAESSLMADKVSAARAKISGQLAAKLAGQPLDMSKLDAYLSSPPPITPKPVITRSTVDQSQMLSNREPQPTPVQPSPVNSAAPAPTMPQGDKAGANKAPADRPVPTNPPQPIPAPTPPPPPPPKVVKKAPPKEEWNKDVEAAKKKFGYNAEQEKVVPVIVDSVMKRAEKPSTEKDAAGNMPIDVLYDELIQRLDALASIEQRQKANPTPPAPATPAPATH